MLAAVVPTSPYTLEPPILLQAACRRRTPPSGGQLLFRAFDGLAHDLLDVVHVDPEGLADVDGPDLGPQVGLEVELAADVGALGLAVLADHDEGRKEDGLQADDHRQQTERELVERQPRPENP